MALSRLTLLAQYLLSMLMLTTSPTRTFIDYLLALYHLPREDLLSGARVPRNSFYVHIGSIVFSTLCYLTAYGVIGKNPKEAD